MPHSTAVPGPPPLALAGRQPFGRFFLPGPTEVHPDVVAAMDHPVMSHRSPAMEALLGGMQEPLKALFRTAEPVLLATSSATGFMEAAVRCGVRERVLVVDGGYFGDRFARVAMACGKEVVRVSVHPGETLEPEYLEPFLDGPDVDAVTLVHSETSTGALAPLGELARVIRARSDALILVDAVTSLGASPVETDAWGVDFIFTGSQKALAVPPGIALAVASARMRERARQVAARGWYLDVLLHDVASRRNQPTQTPAMPQFFALNRQLERIAEEGGIEARLRRHHEMLLAVERWQVDQPHVRFFAREGRRSWAVSALEVTGRIPATELAKSLRERGWTIGTGLDDMAPRLLRIGHMGDLDVTHVETMLAELSDVLARAEGRG